MGGIATLRCDAAGPSLTRSVGANDALTIVHDLPELPAPAAKALPVPPTGYRSDAPVAS